MSKIFLVFERLVFKFLFELSKQQLHPKTFGFQSGKNAVLQLIDYVETFYRNKTHTRSFLDRNKVFDGLQPQFFITKFKLFRFDLELPALFIERR